ncbi:MAG: Spy/CpxP family protein refolding chaperone [Betaproteobacteria bacterium]|nr:Spy/CpxP family protein refolding chaperone [Betaproteobacteria bacterium]
MKRTSKIALGIGTALSLALASAVVNAHPFGNGPGWGMGSGMGPMGGMMGGMGYGPMGRGMGPQGFGDPSAMVEGRLASLKSELKITPVQETAWQAYAGKAKQQAEAMQALRTTMQSSTQASAPERLALRTEMMKKRGEQMEGMTSAIKDLYAALTPEQKAIADQRMGGFGPMAGRGFGAGPGGRFR